LPYFLFSFRHYLVGVIQEVLEARFEGKLHWAELKAECREKGIACFEKMGYLISILR